MKSVNCPNCQKEVIWNEESKWRPFCCERCKLIDLGDWLTEKNRVPCEDEPFSEEISQTIN